jgi:hypothetical protein
MSAALVGITYTKVFKMAVTVGHHPFRIPTHSLSSRQGLFSAPCMIADEILFRSSLTDAVRQCGWPRALEIRHITLMLCGRERAVNVEQCRNSYRYQAIRQWKGQMKNKHSATPPDNVTRQWTSRMGANWLRFWCRVPAYIQLPLYRS